MCAADAGHLLDALGLEVGEEAPLDVEPIGLEGVGAAAVGDLFEEEAGDCWGFDS